MEAEIYSQWRFHQKHTSGALRQDAESKRGQPVSGVVTLTKKLYKIQGIPFLLTRPCLVNEDYAVISQRQQQDFSFASLSPLPFPRFKVEISKLALRLISCMTVSASFLMAKAQDLVKSNLRREGRVLLAYRRRIQPMVVGEA